MTSIAYILAAAAFFAAFLFALSARRQAQRADALARSLENAEVEHAADLEARATSRLEKEREQWESERRRRIDEVAKREREIAKRQAEVTKRRDQLEERAAALDGRAEELAENSRALDLRISKTAEREKRLAQSEDMLRRKLEEVAGLSSDDARNRLLAEVSTEIEGEVSRLVGKAEKAARAEIDERITNLALNALSRVRGSVVGEGTIAVVRLPSDEMKGRIIGREGRNIRSIENATGVDLLIDDTPGAIVLSSWDPLRRAVAVKAVENLVEDGRIHPARIEEVVEKTRREVDDIARERGESLCYELGVSGFSARLVLLLGKLDFITEGGQTLLDRARSVAWIAGAIADELRISGDRLRRAGLLHEIARAEEDGRPGHSAVLSADLVQRLGESAEVSQAIRTLAQAPDAPRTPDGLILATARRMAISRPGARKENLQRHMDRLSDVEEIARRSEGVTDAVVVRAGREMRVHVRAADVSDETTTLLARRLAREVEEKIDYPGQIRILVIRETRAITYAV